jgi:hypothetical protein
VYAPVYGSEKELKDLEGGIERIVEWWIG